MAVFVVEKIAYELSRHDAIAPDVQITLQLHDAPLFQRAVGFSIFGRTVKKDSYNIIQYNINKLNTKIM